jgi:parvulin-like peptidyl-prolyl isomerase
MKKIAALLVLLAGCGQSAPTTTSSTPPGVTKPEPDRIVVQHILISFAGAARSKQTRTKGEAQLLANELLGRAQKGEDFRELMKRYSDDPGPGEYGMANNGINPADPQTEYPRKGMVPAFGNTGFKLEVGEIALAAHDPATSPFGWHIIKRVK